MCSLCPHTFSCCLMSRRTLHNINQMRLLIICQPENSCLLSLQLWKPESRTSCMHSVLFSEQTLLCWIPPLANSWCMLLLETNFCRNLWPRHGQTEQRDELHTASGGALQWPPNRKYNYAAPTGRMISYSDSTAPVSHTNPPVLV